jgi:hypothetical protein
MSSRCVGHRRHLVTLVSCVLVLCAALAPAASRAQSARSGEVCPAPASSSTGVSVPVAGAPATGATYAAPEEIVACVGPHAITGAIFDHWIAVARGAARTRTRSRVNQPAPTPQEALQEVMGFLISTGWVLAEAHALDLHVSEAKVRHTFARLAREQFPKRRGLRAFLRSSGETIADLVYRVKLTLLSTKIQKHAIAGQHGAAAQQQALDGFVKEFHARWLAQTYCAQSFAIADCGHVEATV